MKETTNVKETTIKRRRLGALLAATVAVLAFSVPATAAEAKVPVGAQGLKNSYNGSGFGYANSDGNDGSVGVQGLKNGYGGYGGQ
jgi:hypothetical protein